MGPALLLKKYRRVEIITGDAHHCRPAKDGVRIKPSHSARVLL